MKRKKRQYWLDKTMVTFTGSHGRVTPGMLRFNMLATSRYQLTQYTSCDLLWEELELRLDLRRDEKGERKVTRIKRIYNGGDYSYATVNASKWIRKHPDLLALIREGMAKEVFLEDRTLVIPFLNASPQDLRTETDKTIRMTLNFKTLHEKVAEMEGKTFSEYVRDALDSYVEDYYPYVWHNLSREEILSGISPSQQECLQQP